MNLSVENEDQFWSLDHEGYDRYSNHSKVFEVLDANSLIK